MNVPDERDMYRGAQCPNSCQMHERRLEAARRRYAAYNRLPAPEAAARISVAGWRTVTDGCQTAPATMYDRETLMNQIMMQDFEAYELCLYLDTHPDDRDALAMHRNAVMRAGELKAEFESRFGPLTHRGVQSETAWSWGDNPWPWDSGR